MERRRARCPARVSRRGGCPILARATPHGEGHCLTIGADDMPFLTYPSSTFGHRLTHCSNILGVPYFRRR